jgi:hypothetical protein
MRPLIAFSGRTIRLTTLLLAVLSTAAATGACTNSDDNLSREASRHYVIDFYAGRTAGAEVGGGWYRTLDETLPNVTYAHEDGRRVTIADHVAVGRITDVEKGWGFRIEGDDAPDGIETDFDDPRARWWTVHATVAVEKGLASQTPRQIRVMLPSGGPEDFAKMASGLIALGRVVVFLDRTHPLSAYDKSLYWVIDEEGLLVATVAPDGRLDLPLMPRRRAAELLAGVSSFADLERRSREPRTIQMVGGKAEEARRADGK